MVYNIPFTGSVLAYIELLLPCNGTVSAEEFRFRNSIAETLGFFPLKIKVSSLDPLLFQGKKVLAMQKKLLGIR